MLNDNYGKHNRLDMASWQSESLWTETDKWEKSISRHYEPIPNQYRLILIVLYCSAYFEIPLRRSIVSLITIP